MLVNTISPSFKGVAVKPKTFMTFISGYITKDTVGMVESLGFKAETENDYVYAVKVILEQMKKNQPEVLNKFRLVKEDMQKYADKSIFHPPIFEGFKLNKLIKKVFGDKDKVVLEVKAPVYNPVEITHTWKRLMEAGIYG